MSPVRVLLLGGTAEASALSRALAGDARFAAVLSYAGRTRRPAVQPVPVRIGGFGGVAGLCRWMREHGTAALVDATHPFAARMHANADAAAREEGVPMLRVLRPPWTAGAGDRWTPVSSVAEAAEALGPAPRRVFLAIGGTDLRPFAGTPHQLLIRTVDPPASLPAGARLITARGPFAADEEEALLRRERVEVLVTKNSGGAATAGKLHAARRLQLPVVMIARPALPGGPVVPGVEAAQAWLHALAARRGV